MIFWGFTLLHDDCLGGIRRVHDLAQPNIGLYLRPSAHFLATVYRQVVNS